MTFRLAAAALVLMLSAALASAQTASGSIAGRVTDSNHNPVVGASVYAVSGPTNTGRGNAVTTDNDGYFRMNNMPPGTYTLSAFKQQDGYGDAALPFYASHSQPLVNVSVSSATQANGVELTLGRAGGTLHIMATDAVTHKPLNRATIVLRRSNNSSAVLQAQRDLPTEFLVPSADVSVEVDADGYASWSFREDGHDYILLRPGEERTITAQLQPSGHPGK